MSSPVSRRNFARLFALGGSAALFSDPAWARQAPAAGPLAHRRRVCRRDVLDERARPVRRAARAGRDERRQPVPRLEDGTRNASTRNAERRSGSVAEQSRQALPGEGEHAQGARRVPARDAGRDHHHAQHQRVEQPRVERPRPQGRRRSHRSWGQPPEQPQRVARKGQALRVLGRDRRAEEPASRPRLLRRRVHARHHAADEGPLLHPSLEHGWRSDAGQGAVPDRARARCLDARRRSAELRAARRQPRGHAAGLLLRQRPQVAVRRARVRRALRQQDRRRRGSGRASTAPIPARWASRARSRASASATRPR